MMVVSLAPPETGGRGQGLGFTAPAQPKSSERTSEEDLMEPSEEDITEGNCNVMDICKGI